MAANSESGYVDNWQENKTLTECNLHMLISEDSCDVNFRVGKKEELVKAHRFVLISRSCVFHAMLCGPLAERDDIKIPDVSKDLFADFLKFLYTDVCFLTPENVTGILYLSKKYAVGKLALRCLSFLKTSLSAENACVVMEQTHLFDEKDLYEEAFQIVVNESEISLKTSGFKDMCHTCFEKILKSDDLDAEPDVVFSAALLWAKAECSRQGKELCPENKRLVLGESVYQICFTNFDAKDFVKVVIPSKILTDSECLTILSHLTYPNPDVAPFRIFKAKLHKVKLHPTTIKDICHDEVYLAYYGCVKDSIIVTSSHDIYLYGIALYAADVDYKISVKCGQSYILSDESFRTKVDSTTNVCEIDLRKYSIFLEKYTELLLTVYHHGSKNVPAECGRDRIQSFKCGKYRLTLKTGHFDDFDYHRAMIAQLMISGSASDNADR